MIEVSDRPHRAASNCLKTHLHGVLILSRERVDGPLLDTLLALRQALVPMRAKISRWIGGCDATMIEKPGEGDAKREGTHFPTAMIASRVYLRVVGRQTKVSHHGVRRVSRFTLHGSTGGLKSKTHRKLG